MTVWLTLLLSLLPAPLARAEEAPGVADPGVAVRIVRALGSEIDLFSDCDRPKRKPLLLAASGGTVRQIALKCRDGAAGFDVYLSYQEQGGIRGKDFLKEAYFRSTNAEAESLLRKLADRVGREGTERELAFVRYREADAVTDLTVSVEGFSWTLLSGSTYAEKLKALGEKQSSVQATDPVAVKLPRLGKVEVASTSFSPAWSLVHVMQDDGAVWRVPVEFGIVALSTLPISAAEAVLKLQSTRDSVFYRVDAVGRKLVKLSLVERSVATKDTETRYALMPSAKTSSPYYAFDLVRVEVRRDAAGNVRSSLEKVLGSCTWDEARLDYVCPKT